MAKRQSVPAVLCRLLLHGCLGAMPMLACAQEPVPAPAPPVTSSPAANVPLADPTAPAGQAAPATPTESATEPAQVTPASAAAAALPTAKAGDGAKHKKDAYTGPTEIVVLPPTPMLDEEGKQRLDLDGKPMFNPPVKQQRDKHGHPLFDEASKPVFQTRTELGYDENGKKLHAEKDKPPKSTPVAIVAGTFTVDGVIGKAALNYDIADLKFVYLYAPGIGIAVISNEPFPGSTEQKNAWDNQTLTVTVGEHTLQLYSEKRLLDKKPEPAYVLLDRQFTLPSRFPAVGYGAVNRAPYAWPGAKPNEVKAGLAVQAPPPPPNLLPVQLLKPCPAGQMRAAAPKVLPGQTAPEQPCVPIPKADPNAIAAAPHL